MRRFALLFVVLLAHPLALRAMEPYGPHTPAQVSERLQHALRGNAVQAILPMLDFDATVTMPGRAIGEVPFAGTYTGWPQIAQLLEAINDTLQFQAIDYEYQIAADGRTILHLDVSAYVIPTGKILRLEWALLMGFDETNHIASLRIFYDTWSMWRAFQPDSDVVVTDLRPLPNDFTVTTSAIDTGALVAAAYDSFFVYGDIGAVLAVFNDSSIWCLKGDPDLPWYGYYVGAYGFLQFVNNMLSHSVYASPAADIVSITAQGNRAEAVITEHQIDPLTGALANVDILQAFDFNADGTIKQFDSFNDSYELYRVFVR